MSILLCILVPIVIFIYYLQNKRKRKKSYIWVKSIWYFYSAIFLIIKYYADNSINDVYVTGFAISLALFEGIPSIWELTIDKLFVFVRCTNGNLLKKIFIKDYNLKCITENEDEDSKKCCHVFCKYCVRNRNKITCMKTLSNYDKYDEI